MLKTTFYFIRKVFWFLRYLIFCPDFVGHVGERPDKKAKVSFKIYGIRDWEINNYSNYIAPYLKK